MPGSCKDSVVGDRKKGFSCFLMIDLHESSVDGCLWDACRLKNCYQISFLSVSRRCLKVISELKGKWR